MDEIKRTGNAITEGVIWKQLLLFFFPILFGTFFQQLYNTADAIIVGRFVSTEALAAVGGPTAVLINLLVNLLVGISSGATVTVAQYYGGGQLEEVSKTVHASIALALIGGAGLGILGLLASPWALRAIDTPPSILADSITYMRIYFFGMIPSFIYNVGAGILRAVGDTRRPLIFLIAACLTNIVLDLVFVVVLGMGVAGVGLATILSQLLAAILVVHSLVRADYPCQLNFREIRFSREALRRVLRVGVPAGLQADLYAISNILIQSSLNTFGVTTIAAWTAFGKIDGIFWMIMGAYGIAVTTFVGQNFGAQQYARVRRSIRVCLGMAMVTAVACSVAMTLFARPLLGMFTDDTAVLEVGMQTMRWIAPFYFTYVCVEILASAVRGVGNALVPMLMTGFGICVLRVIWVFFVMPLDWQFKTLVISYPITWAATSILFVLYYLHGGWLRHQIRKAGFAPEERKKPKPKEL